MTTMEARLRLARRTNTRLRQERDEARAERDALEERVAALEAAAGIARGGAS